MKKLIVFLIVVAFVLGGCAKKIKLDENVKLSYVKPTGEVKISVWYAITGASGDAFKALVDEYSAQNPNIKIELSYSGSYPDTAAKVSANLATNTAPDVALMAAGPLYTGGRNDYKIETLVEDPSFKKADIYSGVWEYAKFNGRICAIPYGISTPVLFYNKSIIKAAGIDMTNPPKTWAELLTLAKTAKEKGNISASNDFWGFEVSDTPWLFKTMLKQNGNSVIKANDEENTPIFNQANAVEVGDFWKSLIDTKVMPVGEHANAEKKFLAGNVAFMVATSNRIQRWASNKTFELGAVAMPGFDNQSVALGGNVLVTFSTDQQKLAASWDLIKFLSNTENQTNFAVATGYLPIRKTSSDQTVLKDAIIANPMLNVSIAQLGKAWSYWHFEEMGTMDGIIYTSIENIETGTLTPKEALAKGVTDLLKEME